MGEPSGGIPTGGRRGGDRSGLEARRSRMRSPRRPAAGLVDRGGELPQPDDAAAVLVRSVRPRRLGEVAPGEVEVVIVDNADQRDVADFAAAQGFRYVSMGGNVGLSAANNRGAELSQGDYLLFANPDLGVQVCDLPVLRAHLDQTEGILTPRLDFPDGRPQSAARAEPLPARQAGPPRRGPQVRAGALPVARRSLRVRSGDVGRGRCHGDVPGDVRARRRLARGVLPLHGGRRAGDSSRGPGHSRLGDRRRALGPRVARGLPPQAQPWPCPARPERAALLSPVIRASSAGRADAKPPRSCWAQPPLGLPSVPAGGASSGVSLRSIENSALALAVSHFTALPAYVE